MANPLNAYYLLHGMANGQKEVIMLSYIRYRLNESENPPLWQIVAGGVVSVGFALIASIVNFA